MPRSILTQLEQPRIPTTLNRRLGRIRTRTRRRRDNQNQRRAFQHWIMQQRLLGIRPTVRQRRAWFTRRRIQRTERKKKRRKEEEDEPGDEPEHYRKPPRPPPPTPPSQALSILPDTEQPIAAGGRKKRRKTHKRKSKRNKRKSKRNKRKSKRKKGSGFGLVYKDGIIPNLKIEELKWAKNNYKTSLKATEIWLNYIKNKEKYAKRGIKIT